MFQLKWVWGRLKGYRALYIFALFLTAILAAGQLVTSTITATIMDTVFYPIQDGSPITQFLIDQLIFLVVLLIGFTLLRTSMQYGMVITFEFISQKVTYQLRKDLYKNMQEQDSKFYSEHRTGDLMTRLTGDMDMIRHMICWVGRQLLECVVLFLSSSIYFLITDWLFALSLLIVTPIIFAIAVRFGKTIRPMFGNLRERLSQLNTAAQENIAGNRVVKAFAREEYERERFDEKNSEYRKANLKTSLTWLKFFPFIDALSQSLSIAVLLVGGIFLITGRITIGTFALFNSLCWTLTMPMRMLGMHINDFQRFSASATKITELYFTKPDIAEPEKPADVKDRVEGRIDFENVGLTLNHSKVLHNVDLHIKPGETIAIMGPTGCGKTSLINLIPRFHDTTEGTVKIDGIPVNEYPLTKLRGAVGLATQDVFLFSDSVDGNIAYGDSDMSEDDVKRYAKMACVDFAEKLPDGFDTIIGERGTGLSGGQKQRIALARALAVRPSILILDDTTSAVDLETEAYIQEQLASLDFNCTKIIIAQRISTSKRADRIIVMDKGEIVQIGTHAELSKQPGYYREVFLLQNGEE